MAEEPESALKVISCTSSDGDCSGAYQRCSSLPKALPLPTYCRVNRSDLLKEFTAGILM